MSTVRKDQRHDTQEYGDAYRITDTLKILKLAGVALFFFGVTLYCMYETFARDEVGVLILALIAAVISAVFLLIVKANWGGIVLDFHNDTLEFPGGGVAANEMTDYLTPEYILQVFKRRQVPISEIRQLECYEKYTSKIIDGRVKKTITPYLALNGSFGAVDIKFASEGKRDELYSALREVNEMGIPVVSQ